jgi:hypothetical protein
MFGLLKPCILKLILVGSTSVLILLNLDVIINSHYLWKRRQLLHDLHLVELPQVVHALLKEEAIMISVGANHDHTIKLSIFEALFVFCPKNIQRLVFRNPKLNQQ